MATPSKPSRRPAHDDDHAPPERRRARLYFAIALVLGLLFLFSRMIARFIPGLVMGIVLWSMTGWLYDRLDRATRGRHTVAAGLTVLGTVLVVVAPVALLLTVVVIDAANLVQALGSWIEPYRPELERRFNDLAHGGTLSVFGMTVRAPEIFSRLEQFGTRAAGFLLALSQRAANGLLDALVVVFIMLYTQFFFCRDGARFLAWLARMLPLAPDQSRALFDDFFATAKSTLKTFVAIGAIQGGLGGLAFWVVGIPAPLFWTVVMAFASAIPSVGAQLILVPASIVLLVIGKTWTGLGLLAWSLGVISLVDNVVRPYVVGRDVDVHEVLILVSTFGGIATFGAFGLVIGPVVAALLQASLRIYADVTEREAPAAAAGPVPLPQEEREAG